MRKKLLQLLEQQTNKKMVEGVVKTLTSPLVVALGVPLLRRRGNETDIGRRGRARRKKRAAPTRPIGFQSCGEWGANLRAIGQRRRRRRP